MSGIAYRFCRDRARAAWVEAEHGGNPFVDLREDRAAILLASWLKDETEGGTPALLGFYADVLNAAISEVNWNEIATNWVEEIDTTDGEGDGID